MKRFLIAIATASLLSLPLFAQHGGHAGGMGPGANPGGGMGSSMSSAHGDSGMSDTRGNSGMDNHSGMNNHSADSNSSMHSKSPSDLLTQNTKLSEKLQGLLPAGTDLQAAASGFKNLGQFVAAVHVSHNLGISFDDLKAKLTGDNAESLGKAIKELKPDANSKSEAKKANKQAEQDIKDSQTEG